MSKTNQYTHDFISHREVWRSALLIALEESPDKDTVDFWRHELLAFDRAFTEFAENHKEEV